jgi:hypothetical protein
MWREHAVEADERMPGRRNQSGQASQELDRAHHAVRLLPPAQGIRNATVRQAAQPLQTQRGSSAVAKQSLATVAVLRVDADSRMNVEAARLGRAALTPR